MRNFNRLHSYTTGEFFNTWLSKDEDFYIQVEVFGEGCEFGLFPQINTHGERMSRYQRIPSADRRYTTMRKCLETYYKIIDND